MVVVARTARRLDERRRVRTGGLGHLGCSPPLGLPDGGPVLGSALDPEARARLAAWPPR